MNEIIHIHTETHTHSHTFKHLVSATTEGRGAFMPFTSPMYPSFSSIVGEDNSGSRYKTALRNILEAL